MEEHRKALAALRSEVDELERVAHRRGGALRAVTSPVQPEDVQARIPARTALVELVSYQTFDPAPAPGQSAWGTRRLAAFLVRREGEPVWADLGEASKIETPLKGFRTALRTISPAQQGNIRASGRALYDSLIAPLAPQLEGVDTLLIAPDGQLNLVPFGALVDEQNRFLVERFTITYLTSGRDLLRTDAKAERNHALVMAAPDFGTAAKAGASSPEPADVKRSRSFGARQFEPLPGTRAEATAIAKMLGVRPLMGAQADEASLKEVEGPRVLHLATHAFFLEDEAEAPRDTRAAGGDRK